MTLLDLYFLVGQQFSVLVEITTVPVLKTFTAYPAQPLRSLGQDVY